MSREGSEGHEVNGVQQGLSPTRQQHVRHGAEFFNIFLTNICVAYCVLHIAVCLVSFVWDLCVVWYCAECKKLVHICKKIVAFRVDSINCVNLF
jgi:hypothetical protein